MRDGERKEKNTRLGERYFQPVVGCLVWPVKELDQSAPAAHPRLGQLLLPLTSVQHLQSMRQARFYGDGKDATSLVMGGHAPRETGIVTKHSR